MLLNIPRYWEEYKIHWIKYPMMRVLIPFIIGILLADTIKIDLWFLLVTLVVLLFVCLIIHYKIRSNLEFIPWFGMGTVLFFYFFGLFWAKIRNELNHTSHFYPGTYTSLVTKFYYVEEKDKYWDCYADVLRQEKDSVWLKVNGKILIRINKSSAYLPNARDIIKGDYRILRPDHASAPFEFDWADLLEHRNIHYLTYLDTNKYYLIKKSTISILEKCRKWSDEKIIEVFGDSRDYPVATAILLGLRRKIDPELYRAYSATGAVHVLAVSGLHVGIIASIIEFILGFFVKKFKSPKFVMPVVIITVIWLYTLLTGATPSIMRSAIMFTLFIVGKYRQKDAQPLNILSAAAFVLLMINPLDIYNIGFQLSFGAMAGIFILYDPIRILFEIENKILQWIWQILAVSFAAQLVIYPIVGYHFHQFAFYFWLTSLVSTPFSYFILASGMAIFPIKALGLKFLYWIDYILVYSVKWMNDIIAWLYTMPLGKLRGWWPTEWDCFLLILFSIILAKFLDKKNYKTMMPLLVILIIFFAVSSIRNFRNNYKSELIVSKFRGKDKVWLKYKNMLVQLKGDTISNSNYIDRYSIKRDNINLLDSLKNTCSVDNLKILKNTINYDGSTYKILWSDRDPLKETDAIISLFVLNKNWMPQRQIADIKSVYFFDSLQYKRSNSFFPLAKVFLIQNSYVQVPLK